MGFAALAKIVEGWSDVGDLKFAFLMLDENLQKWLKKHWKENKNWKDRMNALRKKAELP